jgi:hypothetical protein
MTSTQEYLLATISLSRYVGKTRRKKVIRVIGKRKNHSLWLKLLLRLCGFEMYQAGE